MRIGIAMALVALVPETKTLMHSGTYALVETDKLDPKHPVDCLILRQIDLSQKLKAQKGKEERTAIDKLIRQKYRITGSVLPSIASIVPVPEPEVGNRTRAAYGHTQIELLFRQHNGDDSMPMFVIELIDAESFPDDPALPIESLLQA